MLALLKKEFSGFFNSLTAYLVIGIFLLFSGLMFWLYPETNVLNYGYSDMGAFFSWSPFLFLFFIPAITMRMFSEEIKSGTLELLFTRPVTVHQVVMAKFLAALLIVVLALIPTLIYYVSLYSLGNPKGNIDTAAVFGSYFGLILLAAVYVSIGIFASSQTKNQAVAFLLAAVLSYFTYIGLDQLSQLFTGGLAFIFTYLSLDYHFNSIGRGVLDSRDILYFISLIIVFLFSTRFSLNKLRR